MMPLWDYHTHNHLCNHAKGELEAYVQSAIAKGLQGIGLSDHFPMDLLPESADVWKYSMTPDQFPIYLQTVKALREKYRAQIDVKVAAELDYFGPIFEPYKARVLPFLPEMDYVIGSIHVVGWSGVEAWGVDDEKFLAKFREYGADKVYSEYYNCVLGMVKTGFFNIVGHMDLPKKYGIRPDHPEVVWDKVLSVLDAIERSDMAVEINTSGLLKPVQEPYPAESILQECIRRHIPITVGSDSHDPANVGSNFDRVVAHAQR